MMRAILTEQERSSARFSNSTGTAFESRIKDKRVQIKTIGDNIASERLCLKKKKNPAKIFFGIGQRVTILDFLTSHRVTSQKS